MNRITQLLNIQYPIIQAGMIWCSGWKLASAVSNAGGLGVIGAGSMYPDVLREHIIKCKAATDKPFAVNLPLLYADVESHIQSIVELGVPIVVTSAGNPATYTARFKAEGIKVIHVVANTKFAKKCEEAGVDAIVAEGFEAGGHNGREETTTMCLIPQISRECNLPLIAAGGIACGRSMLAAIALGADAVQIGTRFVVANESSAHAAFKQAIIDASEGSTKLSMKKLVPVRLLENNFAKQIHEAENRGADRAELAEILGRARAKRGMFEGDMQEGELEIGQVASSIYKTESANEIFKNIWNEFLLEKEKLAKMPF